MPTGQTTEPFKVTKEECERIEQALKDDTFRKMFFDYMEENIRPGKPDVCTRKKSKRWRPSVV